MLVPIALAFSWRIALVCAGVLPFLVLAILLLNREKLHLPVVGAVRTGAAAAPEDRFGFLRIPAVWMCFGFFFFSAIALSVVQAFAPEAARHLHGMPLGLVASCLTVYMVCSAGGMVLGGFLVADPARCERIIGIGFGMAAAIALILAWVDVPGLMVPVLFGLMGFAAGTGGPSRDLIVKRSTPPNSTGRVYGVVYSGLDIGQAMSPLVFGTLMDHQQYKSVLIGLALVQAMLIASAFNVGRVRRPELAT
jgi:predicted MFS family arabinose efflux permease